MKLKKLANNFHSLEIAGVTLWFSYENLIGFGPSSVDPKRGKFFYGRKRK